MTLSAIGDAETPAGGSVCIRYNKATVSESPRSRQELLVVVAATTYLEVPHEATAS